MGRKSNKTSQESCSFVQKRMLRELITLYEQRAELLLADLREAEKLDDESKVSSLRNEYARTVKTIDKYKKMVGE